MTVQEAVDKVRKIQKDLDQGRLRVPYPKEVRESLVACSDVFTVYSTDNEKAKSLFERLEAPEPQTAELPWC